MNRHFSKEAVRTAREHPRRCCARVVFREALIRSRTRHRSQPAMADTAVVIPGATTTEDGGGGAAGTPAGPWWALPRAPGLEDVLAAPQKVKHRATLQVSSSTLLFLHKTAGNRAPNGYLCAVFARGPLTVAPRGNNPSVLQQRHGPPKWGPSVRWDIFSQNKDWKSDPLLNADKPRRRSPRRERDTHGQS